MQASMMQPNPHHVVDGHSTTGIRLSTPQTCVRAQYLADERREAMAPAEALDTLVMAQLRVGRERRLAHRAVVQEELALVQRRTADKKERSSTAPSHDGAPTQSKRR